LGIRSCENRAGNNCGLGNLVSLREISTTTNITTTNNNNKKTTTSTRIPKTKVIRISEDLYQRLREHSQKYYNIETYETIIKDLLDCYNKQHGKKYYF
jgi:hypothetical protein